MLSLKNIALEPLHHAFGEAFSNHEPSKLLIAYMAKIIEEGHLCLPLEILEQDEQTLILDLINQCEKKLISFQKEIKATPLYFENNCLYVHKSYKAEITFCQELKRYLDTFTDETALSFTYDQECNEKQNEAIRAAVEPGMLILTGGPGTGKTYTAKKIALQLLEKSHFFKKVLILAAPTSKALDQLKKSIGVLPKEVEVIADTLHKLVEFKSKKPAYLNGSCIIIDEASMIEAPLMAKLFSSLGSKAKLILMGDPYQLPPVGMGAIFQDLVQIKNLEPRINHVHLEQVQRCDDTSLKGLSEIINSQSYEEFENYLSLPHHSLSVILKPLEAFSHENFKIIGDFFENESFYHDDLNDLAKLKIHSIILSTLKKGPLGVDAINSKLHEYFFHKHINKRYYIEPIMILENDREENLFNGETGFKIYDRTEKKYLFFIKSSFKNSISVDYTPSFALSVHKSQGSEYDHVLFMVPEGSEKFSKEIVYTACTRVKKTLKLWFCKEPLKAAMIKKTARFSGILKRYKLIEKKLNF